MALPSAAGGLTPPSLEKQASAAGELIPQRWEAWFRNVPGFPRFQDPGAREFRNIGLPEFSIFESKVLAGPLHSDIKHAFYHGSRLPCKNACLMSECHGPANTFESKIENSGGRKFRNPGKQEVPGSQNTAGSVAKSFAGGLLHR